MKTFLTGTLLAVLALVPARFAVAQNALPAVVLEPQKLVIEVEIPASLSEVWKAFSTSDGLITWLAPSAVG